ncbi:hypothetical protein GWK47_014243 [Chionoecetes opilio]|uniref:Uncharacterized protein n=1 Tax=Chionoecetes opilio TaxID=41210 RepID=A0A8J4Y3W2_CHIOP|nr:hypothetical protein GWK47_014243 [Chionoecetes opilio]
MSEGNRGVGFGCNGIGNLYTSSPTYKQKTQKTKKRIFKTLVGQKVKKRVQQPFKRMFLEDSRGFYEFHRISKDNFVKLLNLVSPLTRKQDTKLRKAVSPAQRLRISPLIGIPIQDKPQPDIQHNTKVCDALFAVLRGTYLKLPQHLLSGKKWQAALAMFGNFLTA